MTKRLILPMITIMLMTSATLADGIKLPGVTIDENGIKAPGVVIDDEGVKAPGVTIDESGISAPGVRIENGEAGYQSEERFAAVGRPENMMTSSSLRMARSAVIASTVWTFAVMTFQAIAWTG